MLFCDIFREHRPEASTKRKVVNRDYAAWYSFADRFLYDKFAINPTTHNIWELTIRIQSLHRWNFRLMFQIILGRRIGGVIFQPKRDTLPRYHEGQNCLKRYGLLRRYPAGNRNRFHWFTVWPMPSCANFFICSSYCSTEGNIFRSFGSSESRGGAGINFAAEAERSRPNSFFPSASGIISWRCRRARCPSYPAFAACCQPSFMRNKTRAEGLHVSSQRFLPSYWRRCSAPVFFRHRQEMC